MILVRRTTDESAAIVRLLACLVSLTSWIGVSAPSHAQNIWDVNGGGAYGIGSNWSSGSVPVSNTDVIISTPDGVSTAAVTAFDGGGSVALYQANDLTVLANGANPAHSITVGSNARLIVSGDIDNDGAIVLDSSAFVPGLSPSANLRIVNSDMSLSGSGTLSLSDSPHGNIVESFGNHQLTQGAGHTIEGRGFIGWINSELDVVNHGLIDASVAGETLVVDPRNTTDPLDVTFDNDGTARASNGGILRLQAGNYSGSGTYEALAGSSVWLDSATLRNTTLSSGGDGTVLAFSNPTLENVTNNADLRLSNGHDLTLTGSFINTTTFSTNTTAGGIGEIILNGDVAITGGGTMTLTENDRFRGASGSVTLTNVNNTIQGRGRLGGTNSQLNVVNQGLIDANVSGEALVLDPRNTTDPLDISFDNQSTAQASNGGILRLQAGNYSGTGSFTALAGSSIWLDAATLRNTTLASVNDGTVLAFSNPTLDNVTNHADLRVADGHDLRLTGTLHNTATLSTNAGNSSEILLSDDTVLTGGGEVILKQMDRIRRVSGEVMLTNTDNTIRGAGQLGGTNSLLVVVNQGTIEADVSGDTLTLDPLNGDGTGTPTFDNHGTARATNGATLELAAGEFGGSGVYEALDNSLVWLSSTTVRNTTFSTTGSGLVGVTNSAAHHITNNGRMGVYGARDLDVFGSLTNSGEIEVGLTAGSSELVVVSDTLLSGGGTVTLVESDDRIRAENDSKLTNANNLIQGRGDIDADIVNHGAIMGASPTEFIEINGDLTGDGALANVRIDSLHSPGNSTAIVPLSGSYTIASTGELAIEVAGTMAGSGHDKLDSVGTVHLDGDLTLAVTDRFGPAFSDTFTIAQSMTLSGSFDNALNGDRLDTAEGLGSFVVSYDGVSNAVVLSEFLYEADFDQDQTLDLGDIDSLVAAIAAGSTDPTFDLTGDGIVGADDLAQWLSDAGQANLPSGNSYLMGDANLDGSVDGQDFLTWNSNKFTSIAAWSAGDFNADGTIDGADFLIWNGNKFQVADEFESVPEPSVTLLLLACCLFVRARRR